MTKPKVEPKVEEGTDQFGKKRTDQHSSERTDQLEKVDSEETLTRGKRKPEKSYQEYQTNSVKPGEELRTETTQIHENPEEKPT